MLSDHEHVAKAQDQPHDCERPGYVWLEMIIYFGFTFEKFLVFVTLISLTLVLGRFRTVTIFKTQLEDVAKLPKFNFSSPPVFMNQISVNQISVNQNPSLSGIVSALL